MQSTRVVCFDLGGVLVRICRSLAQACERTGLPVRDRPWLESEAAVNARRTVMVAYQAGCLSTNEYFNGLCGALAERYSLDELMMLHDAWLIEEYQGALELVRQVAGLAGVTAACLSNTNERHWRALAAEDGRGPYPSVMALERRFASHLLGLNKPEPAIFSAFERAMSVRGPEILFFDDSSENVAAARDAGWRAELIDPNGDTVAQMRQHLASAGVFVESVV